MKTIGLIGGMSWESTVPYYRIVNETVRDALGGLHSAKVVLHSVDFAEVEELQRTEQWDVAGQLLASAARSLELAGADVIVLCTNTMHKVAPAIEDAIEIPFLHIADPAADALLAAGVDKAGLLGTRFTMEQPFYRDRLASRGIETIVPDAEGRGIVDEVIYEELCRGIISGQSRKRFREVIAQLADAGAQAVVLGCTEIGLLVSEGDSPVPLIDTTALHARAAAEWAMGE